MNQVIEFINLIRGIPSILAYILVKDKTRINMDIERFDIEANCISLVRLMRKELPFRRIFYDRIKGQSKALYYLIRWTYPTMIGFDLGTDINKVGGGLRIYHGYSTIVHCVSIGENCSVFQNVTIGKGKMVNDRDYPVLGNNVCVYTGALVLGGYTIGDNVTIGAGTLVMQDVPSGCTVVGNPMRIVSTNP